MSGHRPGLALHRRHRGHCSNFDASGVTQVDLSPLSPILFKSVTDRSLNSLQAEVACKILAELNPEDHPDTLALDTKAAGRTGGLEIYDACAMAAWCD